MKIKTVDFVFYIASLISGFISSFFIVSNSLLAISFIFMAIFFFLLPKLQILRIENPCALYFLLLIPQLLAVVVPTIFGYEFVYRFFDSYQDAYDYVSLYFIFLMLGCLSLVFGFYFANHKLKVKYKKKYHRFDNIGLVIYAPLLITIIVYFIMAYHVGGVLNIFQMMKYRSKMFDDISGIVSLLSTGYLSVILLILKNEMKKAKWIFIFVSLIVLSTGERGAILFAGMYPAAVVYAFKFGAIKKIKILSISLVFLLVYISIGHLRSFDSSEVSNNGIKIQDVVELLSRTEHQINAAATIKLANESGYIFGEYFPNIFVAFIPRAIYVDKPIVAESASIGMKLKNTNVIAGSGLPPGAVAYSYLNFGIAGIIFLMLLGGIVCGNIYRWAKVGDSDVRILVYSKIGPICYYFFSTEIQMKIIISLFPIFLIYMYGSVLSRIKVRKYI